MAADKRLLKGFLAKTRCLGVCGYRNDVNILQAAAFELLLIAEMQDNEFSGRGIEAIQNKAEAKAGKKGLWADPSPMPPWKFRMPKKKKM
jgi:endonuclease YncB( thermonuclease family)